jgi:hypothetical protein
MVSTPEKLSVDAETNSIVLTLSRGKSMGWMESYSRLGVGSPKGRHSSTPIDARTTIS